MIAENPAKDATAPSPRRSRVRAFTYDEVQRLIGEADDHDTRTIAVTLLVTGLRRSELLALAWDAVDLDAGTINIRRAVLEVDHAPVLVEANKTEASERTMIIPQLLVGLLREQKARVLEAALLWGQGYRREPMLVFPRPDGEPRVPQAVTDRLKTLMRRAKVEARSPVHAWLIPVPPLRWQAAPISRRSRPASAIVRRTSPWRSTSARPSSATQRRRKVSPHWSHARARSEKIRFARSWCNHQSSKRGQKAGDRRDWSRTRKAKCFNKLKRERSRGTKREKVGLENLKTARGASPSWVRIPPLPPKQKHSVRGVRYRSCSQPNATGERHQPMRVVRKSTTGPLRCCCAGAASGPAAAAPSPAANSRGLIRSPRWRAAGTLARLRGRSTWRSSG